MKQADRELVKRQIQTLKPLTVCKLLFPTYLLNDREFRKSFGQLGAIRRFAKDGKLFEFVITKFSLVTLEQKREYIDIDKLLETNKEKTVFESESICAGEFDYKKTSLDALEITFSPLPERIVDKFGGYDKTYFRPRGSAGSAVFFEDAKRLWKGK